MQTKLSSTLTDVRSRHLNLAQVRVTVTPPEGAPIVAPLEMAALRIGTSDVCDIVVNDPRVSREHCEISLGANRGIVLRDLKSKNGTRIGETEIYEAVLTPGATAFIGNTKLTIDVGGKTIVPLSTAWRFGNVLGESLIMRALFAKLEIIAPTSQTILLLGESGTGKEVLARAIHDASARQQGPFVVLDCSAIAPSLIDAELFGFMRGAFTGATHSRPGLLEQANGGTLFLDEIGELPLDQQPKLLRALESRQIRRVGSTRWQTFDARIIAATHRDLRARVVSGEFRKDLFYRLAVMVLDIPSLRDRKEDIPLLVEHFLASHTPMRSLSDLPPNTKELLMGYGWPGNVRELRNIVARLSVFPHLVKEMIASTALPRDSEPNTPNPILRMSLTDGREVVKEQFEKAYVLHKLRESRGNVTHAAEESGISRQRFHELMRRYGITLDDI